MDQITDYLMVRFQTTGTPVIVHQNIEVETISNKKEKHSYARATQRNILIRNGSRHPPKEECIQRNDSMLG